MSTKRIPQQFIDDVLARTDILDLVSQRIQLKKRGGNHFACCPFHNEKSASFSVNQKKQIYHCFGCKASGNAITFLIEHDGMQFLEALESLANRVGLKLPERAQDLPNDYQPMVQLMEQAMRQYQQNFKHHPHAVDYLKNRGLDKNIVRHYGIGYAPPGWENLLRAIGKSPDQQKLLQKAGMLIQKDNGGVYDRFRDRVMFPIRNVRGQVIGFGGRILEQGEPKYMNSPETELFHKRSELYGLFEAREANKKLQRLIIVEGYMDVVSLAQFGISYAVATLGTAATIRHIHSMLRYTDELIFCFDGDAAGQQAAWHALEVMLPVMRDTITARFMLLPDKEDPDSLVRKLGVEQFEKTIHQALSFSEFFYEVLQQRFGLTSLEDKAKFGRSAMQYLSKMPAGILQSIMIEQLAETVHIPIDKLHALIDDVKEPIKPSYKPIDDRPRAPLAPITGLVEQMLTLLMQHPQVAKQVTTPQRLESLASDGCDLLRSVFKLCLTNPSMPTGTLLEHLKDEPYVGLLAQLAVKELLITEEFWGDELNGLINRLVEQQTDEELKSLMALSKQDKLDKSGKMRLMELLKG